MPSPDSSAISLRWTSDRDMVMQGSALAADINGDGTSEFLTAAYQAVIAVDAGGTELWRFMTNRRFMTCPAVLECQGELALIYAGEMNANPSLFYCIDGNGELVWQAEIGQVFWAAPALGDIDGDGRIEVVQGDAAGGVHAFDALTGEKKWQQQIDGECGSAALADITGDGLLETVIATSTAHLCVLNAAGEVLKDIVLGGTIFDPTGEYGAFHICPPVVFTDSTGGVRIVTSVQEPGSLRFVCLDAECTLLWERDTDGGVGSSISVADFNGDGRVDIFATTQTGRLYRWDEDGRVIWNIDTQGFTFAPGAIVDVDGDGSLEYVLCSQLGTVFVFDQDARITHTCQLDSRNAWRCTPAFGKTPEGGVAFALTGGDLGRMYCFDVPANAGTQIEWSAFRGDARSTGAWSGVQPREGVRMTPENLTWDQVLTSGEITFRVKNAAPGEKPLNAECTAVAPDGVRYGATGIIAGNRGILKVPLTVVAAGTYRFSWAVKDGSGALVACGARDLCLQPFENDRARVRQAVISLRDAIDGAPAGATSGIRALMERELAAIEAEAAELASAQEAVPGSCAEFANDVIARTAALTERANRAAVLARISAAVFAEALDATVIPFEGATWENRGVDAELPEDVSLPLRIDRRCVTGEHEPVSIKLLNTGVEPAQVQVRTRASSGSLVVTPHEVKPVPTNPDQNTTAWDPIAPVADDSVIEIPPFETREVWLDIDATNVSSGDHTVEVVFISAEVETRTEITLRVLPFEMDGYDSMRLCMWARYTPESVKDLLAHGNTVFCVGVPPATVTGEGAEPHIEIDFTAFDELVDQLSGHDVFLLLTGVPSLGVEWQDDAYTARLADYLEQVMSHLAEKGVPEEHVALYTWDEVGGHGWDAVRRFVEFGRKALQARPGVKIYINGGGDLPMFEEMAEISAIWCPAFYMLDDKTPVMDFLRNSDAALWTYNCAYMYARPMGWNTKVMNIAGEHRMQAVFATNYGATGIGYWCYNIGDSMWDPVHPEYPIVYQADPDAPTTGSRRWEAVRESVEDARILLALRAMRDDASLSEDARARISRLVDVTLPALADKSLAEMHLGTARYVLDDTNNDRMVNAFRCELLDCVEAVIASR